MTLHAAQSRTDPPMILRLHRTDVTLTPEGALWLHRTRTLVVSDLHLEKGSALARRGMLVPPYDSAATLARLALVVARLQPARIISLGDAFHDGGGPARLDLPDRQALGGLMRGRDWIWVAGNHDPEHDDRLGGAAATETEAEGLTFRHLPSAGAAPGEVAGHLHPAAHVDLGATRVRRYCFATDGERMILPAFGAYAGGLSLRNRAFNGLFHPERLVVGLIGGGAVRLMPGRLAR